jgi:ubiquinone biosynthesis protein UbiJ
MRPDPAALPAALANRMLEREQWARNRLAAHGGRSFRIAVGPATATMHIDDSGSIHSEASAGAPDLTLTVSPFDVPAFLADPKRWDALVAANGDAELAATLKGLAETLPWFVERAFAEVLGPIAGQLAADAGRRMLGFPGYAGARVGESVTSYVRDEVSLAATAGQARSFGDDVADTAARVDSLEARIAALASRLPKAAEV